MMRHTLVLITIVGGAAACGSSASTADAGCDPLYGCRELAGQFPAAPKTALDVLVVVDNSGSMSEEQTSLATCFSRWSDYFDALPAGLPDLHIGVISTNLGLGEFSTTGCMGDGDGGRLQATPRGACTPPDDNYIINVSDGMGGRTTNYPPTTTLADVASCISRLGSTGCGMEQPFEAMKRALDGTVPENEGFLREDALLAILFLGDEDDCSVFDTAMFDVNDATLGPFGSYRCFEYGITCDEPITRDAASYGNCEPRADSPYMHHPDHYAQFLRDLKPPGHVFISMVSGPTAPVNVGLTEDGTPELLAACGAGTLQSATPGIRQAALVNAFPGGSYWTAICEDQLDDAMRNAFVPVGQALAAGLNGGGGCLTGAIAAVADPCRVYDVLADGTRVELPSCAAAEPTCYTIETRPVECDFTESHSLLTVTRATPAADGTSLIADCYRP